MQTIDLTVIADRWCPTSRTYLTYLAKAGFRVRTILLVDFVGAGGRLDRLRRLMGPAIAAMVVRIKRPAWPEFEVRVRDYCARMQGVVEHPIDYTVSFDYAPYAETVTECVAADYDDPHLQKIIMSQQYKTFLYTNGGRVPQVLLQQEGIKILHIHPGVVPHVRGSDGLLWSMAVRGRPGVSCFYMDSGIDTGALIATKEFGPPDFDIRPPVTVEEEANFYRALLMAYDPHLRASLFRDVVVEADGRDLGCLAAKAQNHDRKDNFLWMHPKLRQKVIAELMCDA